MPENEQYQPRSIASSTRQGARKQWRITGDPVGRARRGCRRPRRSRRSRRRGRGRGSRSAGRARGRSRSAPRRRAAGPRGVAGLAVVVEPGLADRPHLLVRAPSAAISAAARVVEAAGLGRVAARPSAKTPSWRSARGDRDRVGLGAEADVEHPLAPRPRAAAATSSSSRRSQRKRWVWESITASQSSAASQ